MHMSIKSGGLLACKISNFVGLFDYLKLHHKMSAKEVIRIIDEYPEFVMLNRRDMLHKKVEMIKANSGKS